ncbi:MULTISPECIES: cardiolipin synthase [unclassified Schlesneria]|uniref:cardiolipin synthase n=1 Tax=unclassified Schlesneria TaxID=2762017 RepID=UPI002EF95B47
MQTALAIITIFGYVLTLTLLPVVLLTKKKQPVSTVAWMMTIITMPYVGAFLFVVFGINQVERRLRRKQAATRSVTRILPQLSHQHHVHHELLDETQRELRRLAERISGSRATVGNRVQLLTNAQQAFDEIAEAILAAESTIHLEYYIWRPDKLGTRLRDLLISKAQRGVRVRFLYDGIGSNLLTYRFLKPMRDAGIQVFSFVPGRSLRERWSINLRNHRKIVIVDGQIGFTGGMNVGDEYLGLDPFYGKWQDTHLRLEGPTVLQLQEVFAIDWKYATGEVLTHDRYFPTPEQTGNIVAQVVASGPDEGSDVFHNLMFAAINSARHRVTLATCYFVPTPSLVSALESASQRGVQTRVLISGPKTYWATLQAARSNYDSLLLAGVKIYEYQAGQFHSKTLSIDGNWSLVGTPNFDSRSLYLNFEVGAVLYDRSLAEQIEHQFHTDLESAMEIEPDKWFARPVWNRLQENFCRMFSPVL